MYDNTPMGLIEQLQAHGLDCWQIILAILAYLILLGIYLIKGE